MKALSTSRGPRRDPDRVDVAFPGGVEDAGAAATVSPTLLGSRFSGLDLGLRTTAAGLRADVRVESERTSGWTSGRTSPPRSRRFRSASAFREARIFAAGW